MKIVPISLLLASLFKSAKAQNSGKCLDLKTSCVDNDGRPCREIPQLKADKCGIEPITISANWCNNTGKTVQITFESILKITGGAITSINDSKPKILPIPTGSLDNGECNEMSWTFDINNCKNFFNYEVNVKTQNDKCRGYYFARQMKTICEASGKVTCALEDGTDCEEYAGPAIKTISEPGCPSITCIDQPSESCRQGIDYGFAVRNRESQEVKFDLANSQIANSKVAFKIVEPNNANFSPLAAGSQRSWNFTKENVNVCRIVPSASINIRGNVIDPKTDKKDLDYQFCFNFKNQKVRKFDDGTKLPFCSDIGPVGLPSVADADADSDRRKNRSPSKKSPSKGKGGKGGKPPTPCPAIIREPKILNDEL